MVKAVVCDTGLGQTHRSVEQNSQEINPYIYGQSIFNKSTEYSEGTTTSARATRYLYANKEGACTPPPAPPHIIYKNELNNTNVKARTIKLLEEHTGITLPMTWILQWILKCDF